MIPIAVGAFDLGGPRHRYRACEVTVNGTGDPIGIVPDESRSVITVSGVRSVGCGELTRSPSWGCLLEEHVAATGTLTVDTTRYEGPTDPFVRLDAGYFRRTVSENNGTTTVSLELVAARTVLETVGDDLHDVPAPLARAVRQGSARSTVEYGTGRYVLDGGKYCYVSRAGQSGGVAGRWGFSTVGALAGLALLARGHRLRIEGRTDE